MEEIQESSGEQQIFQLGEIVWAKIIGYPWWPAIISAIPNPRNTHFRVDFLADNSHAFVSYNKIVKYGLLRVDVDLHKHMNKGLRKAIGAADQALSQQRTQPAPCLTASREVEVPISSQKQLLQSPNNQQTLLQEKSQQTQVLKQFIQLKQEHTLIEIQQPQSEQKVVQQQLGFPYEKRVRYVETLLKKYQLETLPRLTGSTPQSAHLFIRKANKISRKRLIPIKRLGDKKMNNSSKMYRSKPVDYLLGRKIHRLLKQKQGLYEQERKTISLSLSREISSQNGSRQELMRLFKWIDISSPEIITRFYDEWSCLQSQKQKVSNMTVEE